MRLQVREREVSSMRGRRSFDRQFKREITEAIISGKISQLEVSRKYNISPVVVSRWKKEYYSGKFFENTNPDYARLIYKNFLLDPSSINMVCDGIICLKLVTHLPERINL